MIGGNIHHNMPMSSNAVLSHENWNDENSHNDGSFNHYKMGNKIKLGANTSTNFMNGQQMANQQYKMSMLRSVQQNMPNMPNVSETLSSIFINSNKTKRNENEQIYATSPDKNDNRLGHKLNAVSEYTDLVEMQHS